MITNHPSPLFAARGTLQEKKEAGGRQDIGDKFFFFALNSSDQSQVNRNQPWDDTYAKDWSHDWPG